MKSFLSGRIAGPQEAGITPPKDSDNLGLRALSSQSGGACVSGGDSAESEVSFKREGDLIRTIIVKCVCGKITEIDCTYSQKT
jgi:hypothetical protein